MVIGQYHIQHISSHSPRCALNIRLFSNYFASYIVSFSVVHVLSGAQYISFQEPRAERLYSKKFIPVWELAQSVIRVQASVGMAPSAVGIVL